MDKKAHIAVCYSLCMKEEEIKKHILLQDVSDDKAENEDGDNGIGGIKDGVTILSISLSTVLTYGIMLIFYKLKYFKLNQQGQNGGNIPVNWK